MSEGLYFLNLEEIQYHRGFTAKERNKYCNFISVHINITDRTDKFSKGTINDTYTLAFRETDLGLGLLYLFCYLLQNGPDLIFMQRNGLCSRANKTCDTG